MFRTRLWFITCLFSVKDKVISTRILYYYPPPQEHARKREGRKEVSLFVGKEAVHRIDAEKFVMRLFKRTTDFTLALALALAMGLALALALVLILLGLGRTR